MLQNTPMNDPDSKPVSIYEAPSRLTQAIHWFRERVGGKTEGSIKELIEEALLEEAGGDSTISAEEVSLLKNMIHFGELTARDVMLPRSDIMGPAARRVARRPEKPRHRYWPYPHSGVRRVARPYRGVYSCEGFIPVPGAERKIRYRPAFAGYSVYSAQHGPLSIC